MSRVIDDSSASTSPSLLPYFGSTKYHKMNLESHGRVAGEKHTTLGQLLKRVGDDDETPVHHDTSPKTYALPFILTFQNLTYNVKVTRKLHLPGLNFRNTTHNEDQHPRGVFSRTKTLLNDISGEARDGEIMAVLGASGSGKSTLIDALANRIEHGRLKGNIALNGEPLESRLIKVISAYVMQDDLLYPMLTVEETLMFSAEFRLPRALSKSKKKARVQHLIDQLGLRNAAKTIIGDEGHRGVSGGERRRVSIGIDIVHDPIILLLDEPTSGLDSTSAFMVVKVLQRIAQNGSIVIMSIHQPSYRIMNLLDKLIFLSKGHTVFSGSPVELPIYLEEFGSPIPNKENSAEYTLDLIRELEGSQLGTKPLVEFHREWQIKRKNTLPNIEGPPQDNWGGLSLKEAISASISKGKLVSSTTNKNDTSPKSMIPTYVNPIYSEIATLSKRTLTNSSRMPELFCIRLGAVLVTGFILSTIFWKLDNSPKGVRERVGFFAFAMSTTFYTCADALLVFVQEKYIFMRETSFNAYRLSSYVISHAITALPSLIFLSFTFASTTFWSVGLDGGAYGFNFYFAIILASFWAGNSFVSFLSGVVRHILLAFVIVVALLSYFLLFSGFFITRDRIPGYWIWFHYISLVKYPYEGVLQNEFQDPTKCFVRGVQIFDNTLLGDVPNYIKVSLLETISGSLGMNITTSTCVVRGVDILQHQGINDLSKWSCLWIIIAWGFLFRILFYLSLLLGSKNKRS